MSRPESKSGRDQEITHFYLEPLDVDGDQCRFSSEESHHIVSVCRQHEGDSIMAADGAGHLYTVEIIRADSKQTIGHVVEVQEDVNELEIELSVGFGMLTMSKTEEVIDQLTQLGVKRILPLRTEKCLVRLDSKKLPARIERWQRVAIAAMKQSLRCRLPELSGPLSLYELSEKISHNEVTLFGSMRSAESLRQAHLAGRKSILLLTGPEEGFTLVEERQLVAAGAVPISLGKRRLRAELAPVVMTSLALGCGDLR